jgi:hypothetical protein
MFKPVRHIETPATHFREAIARQREMLTDLLTVPMYKADNGGQTTFF